MAFFLGDHPIISSPHNIAFHDVLAMDRDKFSRWAEGVRLFLGKQWHHHGIPPHNGTSLDEIERDMRKLARLDTLDFLQIDSVSGKRDTIVARGRNGAFLRSLFSNMSKSADGNAGGSSIYEYLTADQASEDGTLLCKRWHNTLNRMVHRDRMYAYSQSLKPGSVVALGAPNGARWISQPFDAGVAEHWTDHWVEGVDAKADGSELTLTRCNAYVYMRLGKIKPGDARLPASLDRHHAAQALLGAKPGEAVFPWRKPGHFRIRTYEPKLLFPQLFSMFRTGLVVQGVNFPAQIAKFLYQRYTNRLRDRGEEIVIYDPSMGYGGRCLGALAAASDRPIRYIGTDPNTENWINPDRSRYAVLADHYRGTVGQKYHASVEVFCCGSEDIRKLAAFQKYRGRLDLVFTSPPYFCAEIYSREETQSAIKFRTYDAWRDGFLKPTLETCVEWLKPGGFLLWNVADVKIRNHYVPLQQDSQSTLRDLGMEFVEKLKMPLATVTGGGKLIDGIPTTKNYLMLNGGYRKYEPIFVFRKPK